MHTPDGNHHGDALAGAALIARLRPISGFEEELIADQASTANTAALCNEVLARCLVAAGSDPGALRDAVGRLLVPERDLALVALRRKTFGDRVESEVTCPSCGVVNEISFALSDMPLDVAMPPRELVVEHEGQVVAARLPTAADQEALMASPSATLAERRTALLARILDRVDDRVGPLTAADVRALPSGLRLVVERAIEAALPDVDFSMDVRCVGCSIDFAAPFDLHAFFLPS